MSRSETAVHGSGVGAYVTFGLLAAWALHDAEEVALVPGWAPARVPGLRERFPGVPERIWRRLESVDRREFTAAVAAMGVVVAAAAADGHRTGGRSAFYQSALNGFGLHGVVHLAQAAVVRAYTPGSVTSPLVVIPFTLWARGRLRAAGVLRPTRPRDAVQGLALAGAATVGAHMLSRRLVGKGRTVS
ncbi:MULTISPECIES: HXXEE domain-containing protein [Streptomyces]|uniref:HXXEE domain-containing protein n=1 Tax=Streptomyces TaxID=1883 RepID=UPI001E2C3BBC|nr:MULTISPECIES: HXXEE domain-containing protein [Streptomyces]UFQ13805.1 HXXEE domain-containing protein [Streptomyces huasconensis]WCL83401.1 HXXEE domain-containing protein [Streptomyces sp. JCM 35825]